MPILAARQHSYLNLAPLVHHTGRQCELAGGLNSTTAFHPSGKIVSVLPRFRMHQQRAIMRSNPVRLANVG
jgi:hypothetical protein